MPETCEYLAPDYYPSFACKMGACRSCCCDGWNVSLSMQDYFRLLGVECKKQLRDRLDVALRPALNPTPEHYAEIEHRFNGDCPLRMADGRCAIHAQLGEMQLPVICRLYPRALRGEGDLECSCACSCERVVEMLLHRQAPMTFQRMRLSFAMPLPPRETDAALMAETRQLRRDVVTMLQAREVPLASRMMGVRAALVLEGGGMRAAHTAGIVAALIEHEVWFPYVCGLSAGSSNAVNYLSRDAVRTRQAFVDIAGDERFGGIGSLMRRNGFFNADFLYERAIQDGTLPFDWDTFRANPAQLRIQAFERDTGRTVTWTRDDMTSRVGMASLVRASSTMPFVMKPIEVGGQVMLDGGLGTGAGIPLHMAEEERDREKPHLPVESVQNALIFKRMAARRQLMGGVL